MTSMAMKLMKAADSQSIAGFQQQDHDTVLLLVFYDEIAVALLYCGPNMCMRERETSIKLPSNM
jgi:hypothetical protein